MASHSRYVKTFTTTTKKIYDSAFSVLEAPLAVS